MFSKFYVKLKHSSTETIWMIQKAAARSSWWLAASSRQHTYSCIMSHAEFFGETLNHQGDSGLLKLRFGALWHLAFPKTKIQTADELQENTMGQLIVIPTEDFAECFEQWKRCWENCVRSQGAYSEGDWGIIVLCTMFLVPSSINVSFSHYMARYLLDRPCINIFKNSED